MPVQGLNDYMQILKSPDIYPDIAGAGFFMSPLIKVVSNVIAIAGMVALLFVLLRIGADVLIMSGAGAVVKSKNGKNNLKKFSSFGGEKEAPVGDPMAYIKDFAGNIILMLAFIGLMISGYLMPLAGTVTAATGSIITKISNINPVPYIEALDINLSSIDRTVSRSSVSALMKEYSKHYGNMVSAKQQAEKTTDLSEGDYRRAAASYYNSYYSADILRYQLEGLLHNIRYEASKDSDRTLSKEEEELRSFNFKAHLGNVDSILLASGKGKAEDTIKGDEALEGKAKSLKTTIDGLTLENPYKYENAE